MPYSIRPAPMAEVFHDTGLKRDELLASLAKATEQLGKVREAAAPSAAIASELDAFTAEHGRLVTEVAQRIESALYNGPQAVDAYVRADAAMAEQYGRASVVFAGDRLPPGQLSSGARPAADPATDPYGGPDGLPAPAPVRPPAQVPDVVTGPSSDDVPGPQPDAGSAPGTAQPPPTK